MNLDVLFTTLFWAAGLCLFFWVGLLLAGLAGEMTEDDADKGDGRELLTNRDLHA